MQFTTKQTAANNLTLGRIKKAMSAGIYKRSLELMNSEGGKQAVENYLRKLVPLHHLVELMTGKAAPTPTVHQSLVDAVVLELAKKHFGVETLEERKMDRLDFHSVAVWNIKAALEAAFKAGQDCGAGR